MYYAEPQRKQVFTDKFEQQVNIYEQFVSALKAIIPVISQYEGKVVNIKLVKSIKEVLKNDLFVNITFNQLRFSVGSTERWYRSSVGGGGNVDVSSCELLLSVSDSKRLDSTKSIEIIEQKIEYLTKEITAIQADISFNYDEEVKAYQKLVKEVQEYNNRFSSRLRRCMNI